MFEDVEFRDPSAVARGQDALGLRGVLWLVIHFDLDLPGEAVASVSGSEGPNTRLCKLMSPCLERSSRPDHGEGGNEVT